MTPIRKLILNTALAMGFTAAGFLAGLGNGLSQLPPVEYEVGLSFATPCGEHVTHVNTVTGSRVVRLYEIAGDNGETIEVLGEQLQEALDAVRILQLLPQ